MIHETIARNGYVATESQVEQLAATVAQGRSADSTYLRVLLVQVQNAAAGAKRLRKAGTLGMLGRAHERLYKSVLKGVSVDGCPTAERNRRATFARTAATELRNYVRGGGDVRTLVAGDVTKRGLRSAHAPKVEGSRDERFVQHAASSITRAVQRIARTDGLGARKRLASIIDRLQTTLEKLEASKPSRTVRARGKVENRPTVN